MSRKKFLEELAIELGRSDVRAAGAPPRRLGLSVMKSNAPEEPRIAENESTLRLVQDKMVMVFRAKTGRFDAQLSGHPEMDSDPITAREFEQHLFSPGERAEVTASS